MFKLPLAFSKLTAESRINDLINYYLMLMSDRESNSPLSSSKSSDLTTELLKAALALLFDVVVGTGIELATYEFHIQRSTH